MPDLFIYPGQLHGQVVPPPSKSDAHRALIAAGLAGDLSLVSGLPTVTSDDIRATIRCLKALAAGEKLLDCGESGTTLRLLIPVVAALGAASSGPVTLTGSGRLPQRPLAEYQAIFAGQDLQLNFPQAASLPLQIQGRLRPGIYPVPGHVSSQYISGLLLALPLLPGDSVIRLTTPLESAPYVTMTLRTLKAFGIQVESQPDGYLVPGGQQYLPCAYQVEKDYSQAAFWLTAAYTGSPLEVAGLAGDSAQGDRAILDLLADFRRGAGSFVIDASQIPDLVPILAVAAAFTNSETRIVKAARLRLKESDRLQSTQAALSAIGVDIEQTGDGLLIRGGSFSRRGDYLPGGTADAYADHRIAMALAIAALSTTGGVLIQGAEAVRKSYPDFFNEFRRLGGDVDELNLGSASENQHLW